MIGKVYAQWFTGIYLGFNKRLLVYNIKIKGQNEEGPGKAHVFTPYP
jgi:hypothetical protein